MTILPANNSSHVLVTNGFGAAFGDKVILAEVDVALAPQTLTVLLGPAGTGKSTLLRAIAGLNDRNPRYRNWGQADYLGQPLADEHRPALVQQHARLMQASTLQALTEAVRLQDNNMAPHEIRSWAAEWVARWGFPDLARSLDVPTIDLPTVQQRAVAILRELACRPALLMVDEPTTGLPDYEAHLLLDMLRQASDEHAVLLVLHNQKQTQRVADQVLLLAGGRMQEDASVRQFFDSPLSAAARQFVATGSCAVAAPDAKPEMLAEDVPVPPPLPLMAQMALQAEPESLGPRGFVWVVPGKLAGTPMPGVVLDMDYDLAALKRVGVSCLITLTEGDLSQEPLARHGLTNLHLPIRDREPPTVPQIRMLLIRMEALLARGEVLAVHCLAGIGRTGTVLAAWLISNGLTAQEALRRVRRIEPKFVQTAEQEDFLQLFEDSLLMKLST